MADPAALVSWPDTEPCEGKRIERFVLAVEYEVWEEAGISRQQILDALFEGTPLILPDADGDEGALLQQVEIAEPVPHPVLAGLKAEVEQALTEERHARQAMRVAEDQAQGATDLRGRLVAQTEANLHELAAVLLLKFADRLEHLYKQAGGE